jgi:hypothetical protein
MKQKLILFVHGLGGTGEGTWHLPNRPGFFELIRQDETLSSQYDVEFYQYPTTLFPWPFFSTAPKIQHLAAGLKTQIDNKYAAYSSIVLVCHSLGGLIARQYLIEEVRNQRPLKISKLLLYAVPNNGAGLASVATHISWTHNQLAQLSRDSDLIEFLNRDWRQLKMNDLLRIKYIVAGLDQAVDRPSAESFWGNPNVEEIIDKGHIAVVKPENPTDLAFVILKNFLDERRTTEIVIDLSHSQEKWFGFQEFVNSTRMGVGLTSLLGERQRIDRASVLVISLPFKSQFSDPEAEYVQEWVEKHGGGLLLLGYYAADSHHSGNLNLNLIARRFGYEFCDNQVLPQGAVSGDARTISAADDDRLAVSVQLCGTDGHPLVAQVTNLAFRLACSIKRTHGNQPDYELESSGTSSLWRPVGNRTPEGWLMTIEKWVQEQNKDGAVPLLVATKIGKGRVVLCGTWKICTYSHGDNKRLVENILQWLSPQSD